MATRRKAIALVWIALLGASRVSADPPPPAVAAPAAAPVPQAAASAAHTPGSVLSRLQSSDEAAVQEAIASLTQHSGAAAEAALTARLREGLPPQLCAQAIDTLVLLKVRSAVPVITELMQHRRAEVRARALGALAALGASTASVESLAASALEDPSSDVQTAAIDVLVAIHAHRAIPALFAAYDRGLRSALRAVGALGGPEVVGQLLARAKDGVIDPLVPAFDHLFVRAEFPLQQKRELVRKLASLASPSAQRYLVGLSERLNAKPDPKLQQELSAALQSQPAGTSPARVADPASATVAVKGAPQ